jgi:transcriptional regulator with XRE-family HTH domain
MQRLVLAMEGEENGGSSAEHQLRKNLVELMEFRRMTQADLAELLGKSQSWVSRRLSGKAWEEGGSRFQFEDLDTLARIFGLSPAELLHPGYGKWDRRTGHERRAGPDRRRVRPFRQQGISKTGSDEEGAA